MGVPHIDPLPMSVEEFFAFTDTRPDEEKWELVDGEPILQASASWGHQRIVRNLMMFLGRIEDALNAPWEVLPGLAVRLTDSRVPEPDVVLRPGTPIRGNVCDDVIVAFEVLSPSTASRDLRWKRRAYRDLPSLQHYVVLAQDTIEVVAFDRETQWQERRMEGLEAALELPTLSIVLPLSELYRGTGLAPR